jgi:ribokinase
VALQTLRDAGLNLDLSFVAPETATGTAFIMLDASGQNCIAVAPGANFAWNAARVEGLREAIAGAQMLLLGNEITPAATTRALELARECNTPVLLNYAPVAYKEVPLNEAVTILVVNESEAAALTQHEVTDVASAMVAARALLARGPRQVALTLGALGVVLGDSNGVRHLPAFKVAPVDTVAAGDTFCGALAVAWCEKRPFDTAAQFASAAAAIAVTRAGALPSIPSRAEIESYCRQQKLETHAFFKSSCRQVLWLLCALFAPLARCQAATVEKTIYNGLEAYRLSDGKTEGVVVPALSGRVMRYASVGGANWLWNAPRDKLSGAGYKNYGGDKTFAGPHPAWGTFVDNLWPPDPSWDGAAHVAQVLPSGALRTRGNVWRGFGVRVIREFSFNAAGEFMVSHTIEKVEGEPRQLAIWPVTQTIPPDAVYIPLNEKSAYLWGFHPFGNLPETAKVEPLIELPTEFGKPFLRPKLLKITPTTGGGFKLGADSPVAAIAAVKSGVAFVQRADKWKDQYPDGAEGAGLPVEFYNHGDGGAGQYVELELLSPLYRLKIGESKTLVTRWSLHALPVDIATPEIISQLFQSARKIIVALLNHDFKVEFASPSNRQTSAHFDLETF